MTTVSEIAPDVFRISAFVPDFNLQSNQFVVRNDEPLLFHTGQRAMFAAVRAATQAEAACARGTGGRCTTPSASARRRSFSLRAGVRCLQDRE